MLTADRPQELRGTDANQTIDQSRIYGAFVRESLDAGEPSADELRSVRALACGAVAATLGDGSRPGPCEFSIRKATGAHRTQCRTGGDSPCGGSGGAGRPRGWYANGAGGGGGSRPYRERGACGCVGPGSGWARVDRRGSGHRSRGPWVRQSGIWLAPQDFPCSAILFRVSVSAEHGAEHSVTAYDLFLRGLWMRLLHGKHRTTRNSERCSGPTSFAGLGTHRRPLRYWRSWAG